MEAEQFMEKRLLELAQKAYQNNSYTFTDFMSMSDMTVFYENERSLAYACYKIFGGATQCERVMIRFGNPDELAYEEEFPIRCIRIAPLQDKFADDLTHRDFLGALMNLGIERDKLGDILLQNKEAYVFCHQKIADYILENLTRIRHTTVMCSFSEAPRELSEGKRIEKMIQVNSARIDAVIAKVYNLSRTVSAEYFRAQKVFVNGRLCENFSKVVNPGDCITVRGFGRFVFVGEAGVSKKGKLNVRIELW